MAIRFRKQLASVPTYVPGLPLEEAKRRYNLQEVIKLASNECPLGPFPPVAAKISAWAEEANRYPDTECYELTNRLAQMLGVAIDEIIVTNGTTHLIAVVCQALLEQGDEIVVAAPTFPYYAMAAALMGGIACSVRMAAGYQYDLDAMLSVISPRTKLVAVCNPNNPTGTYVRSDDLQAFVERIPGDVLVLIDEAYFEYVSAADYGSFIARAPNAANLLVTRTFSKIYGLAGLRVGYGVANKYIIDQLKRVPGPFSVNSLGQLAALESLRYPQLVAERKAKNSEWKASLCNGLKRLGVDFVDSQANFVMTKLGVDSSRIAQLFLQRGVIVRPAMADGWIRVTVGTQEENLRFLQVAEEIIGAGVLQL